ncbi:Uncharacterised protein [Mycobacteroides abscessus subsp. abscessus]|nr:Uncharacterised protein [Mycobacteroides abscessus subsp. abscessus]
MGQYCLIDVHLCRFQLGDELGDEELVVLQAADLLTERLALLGVFDGLLQHGDRVCDVGDRTAHPLLRQALHHRDESLVDLADDVLGGHPHIGEEQLGGIGLGLAHFVQLAAALEAGHALLDREQGDALGLQLGRGACRDDDEIGSRTVGDERLGAVDDPVVAVLDGRCLEGRQIGATRGLGHADRGDHLAATELGQPALLLLVGGQLDEVRGDDVEVNGHRGGQGRAGAGQFLLQYRVVAVVAGAAAAELLGDVEAQVTLLTGLFPELAVNVALLDECLGARVDVALHKRLHRLPERLVVLGVDSALHGVIEARV